MTAKTSQFVLAISAALVLAGCGKESGSTSGGMATQGDAPPPAEVYEGIDLAQINGDMKGWVMSTKIRPTSFEDYVEKSRAKIPPAPAGKKYVFSKQMRIVLVDR